MNISIFMGVIAALATIYFGVFKSVSDPLFYLDMHAIILVVGGTASAAMLGFPSSRLVKLSARLFESFFSNPVPAHKVVEQLYYASLVYGQFRNVAPPSVQFTHPFIPEAMSLLKSGQYTEEQLHEILSRRIGSFKKSRLADAKILHSLAKFPPAFGLLGASSGMIAMMLGLSTGGASSIGPAMAIALVATFWGIAVANLVFLPLTDYAKKLATEETQTLQLILQGIMMIRRGEKPQIMLELLRSELPAEERAKVSVLESVPQMRKAAAGEFRGIGDL